MGDVAVWLGHESGTAETAFTAHRPLVDIHPINDGNGRTARLLMNLILIRLGCPTVAVRAKDCLSYIQVLQLAQAGQGIQRFDALLYESLDATLGEYWSALTEAGAKSADRRLRRPKWCEEYTERVNFTRS